MNKSDYMHRKGVMRRIAKEPRMEVFGQDMYLTYKDAIGALEKKIVEHLIGEEGQDLSGALITLETMKGVETLESRETLMEIIGDGIPFNVTRYDQSMGVAVTLRGLMPSKVWGYSGLKEFTFKGTRYHSIYHAKNVRSTGWQYEDSGDYYHSLGGIQSWEDMGNRIRIYMKHGENVVCFESEPNNHPRDLLSRDVVLYRPQLRGVMAYAGTSTVSQSLHRAQPLRFKEAVKRTFAQIGNERVTWKRNDFLVDGIDFKVEGLSLNAYATVADSLKIRYYKASSLKTTDVCYFLYNSNHKGITVLTPAQPIYAALVKSATAPLWFDDVQQHMMLINDYIKTNNKPHGIRHA